MNLQTSPVLRPLRVLMVNPLASSAQLVIGKILSGLVFGQSQLVDLIMLVYSNERDAAEEFKLELYSCAFSCFNSILVSSDLPVITDADVFCFLTDFKNPNSIDVTTEKDNDLFDAMYLVVKIANTLVRPLPAQPETNPKKKMVEKPRKPIILVDGLVAMNIFTFFIKLYNVPGDNIFCPTPLPTLTRNVLAEHLKVQCNEINEVLVWATSDDVFYVEVERPLIIHDKVGKETKCGSGAAGQAHLKAVDLDDTQFNDTWLKKDLIDKVAISASRNPYGCIYRAAEYSKTLRTIFAARSDNETKIHASLGVISDGSLHTIKGLAYILPLVFVGETWTVNKRYEESSHFQQEIKRMNKSIKNVYDKFRPFCKKFLEENVINIAFVPDDDTESVYSFVDRSSRASNALSSVQH